MGYVNRHVNEGSIAEQVCDERSRSSDLASRRLLVGSIGLVLAHERQVDAQRVVAAIVASTAPLRCPKRHDGSSDQGEVHDGNRVDALVVEDRAVHQCLERHRD